MPLPVSQNFERTHLNDDVSSTIINPRFKINGLDGHFATTKNLDGVCFLYGLDHYVLHSLGVVVELQY